MTSSAQPFKESLPPLYHTSLGSMRATSWMSDLWSWGESLWEEPGSGIHRYSPTSATCSSSWLMSRWYYFPRSWRGVWRTCWEALQSFWMVAGGTHSCPEGRCSAGTKHPDTNSARWQFCYRINRWFYVQLMPALHWVPYKYLRNKFFSQWR